MSLAVSQMRKLWLYIQKYLPILEDPEDIWVGLKVAWEIFEIQTLTVRGKPVSVSTK